jgi:uncharacterized protein (DUF433 family)
VKKVLRVDDYRNAPANTVAEASRYLGVPSSTVRSWVMGQTRSRPVFSPADPGPPPCLSFLNVVEAHVLAAIRRRYSVPLQRIRKAVHYLGEALHSGHPLAEHRFETDGVDLFVQKAGITVSASEGGQAVIRELVERYFRRVDWDAKSGGPLRFYPYTRELEEGAAPAADEPRLIVIDPRLGGGQPVIAGRGILVSVIGRRYKAGEAIPDLARDYGCSLEEINEAIRFQFAPAA